MRKLKKRLPALLMALIIAVMPVLMAVPASASSDVLVSSDSYKFGDIDVYLDILYPLSSIVLIYDSDKNAVYLYETANGVLYVAIEDTDPRSVSVYGSGTVEMSMFNVVNGSVSHDNTVINVTETLSDLSVISNRLLFDYVFCGDGLLGSVYGPGDYVDGEFLPGSQYLVSFINRSSVGVLTVFSGVGSFLAGAVGSAITMFYTAEGGLSVLGILAVASLGLAVILLLMSLIAGWLKFK